MLTNCLTRDPSRGGIAASSDGINFTLGPPTNKDTSRTVRDRGRKFRGELPRMYPIRRKAGGESVAHPPCAPRHPEGVLVAYVDGDRPPTAGPLLALFGHPMDDQETQVYAPGTVLLEKYVIDRCVARGGMGIVYRAINLDLEAPVALKTLFVADQECEENLQQRALLEAKLAAKLRGEHIAQVLDAGWLDDRQPYIVMEYLEGRDLRGHIEEQGVLEVAEAVSIVQQACLGLAEAHDRGIVHRDLKPENLFTAEQPDGRQLVKVLDFGISKDTFRSAGPRQLTGPNTILGSPDYMSPEQLEDAAAVDHRTDIWALGCVLYELCALKRPFDASNLFGIVYSVVKGDVDLDAVSPDASDPLRKLVTRLLTKDADVRPTVTARVLRMLRSVGARKAIATSLAARKSRI